MSETSILSTGGGGPIVASLGVQSFQRHLGRLFRDETPPGAVIDPQLLPRRSVVADNCGTGLEDLVPSVPVTVWVRMSEPGVRDAAAWAVGRLPPSAR